MRICARTLFTQQGVHTFGKGGLTGGFTKRGVHRGVNKKGGSREPCEPLATGLARHGSARRRHRHDNSRHGDSIATTRVGTVTATHDPHDMSRHGDSTMRYDSRRHGYATVRHNTSRHGDATATTRVGTASPPCGTTRSSRHGDATVRHDMSRHGDSTMRHDSRWHGHVRHRHCTSRGTETSPARHDCLIQHTLIQRPYRSFISKWLCYIDRYKQSGPQGVFVLHLQFPTV